jgi:thiol-disulfide isomerase/thioredoxin
MSRSQASRPLSRRHLLQGVITLAGGASVAPRVFSQGSQGLTGPAYEVSKWTGPFTALDLPDTGGKTWRLDDLRGRAVLLNFWASWCEPCRAEMPTLQQVADLYGPDKLLVLAINFKEPAARALKFAQTTGVTFPVLLDVAGKVAGQHGVKVFPTTLMINSRGQPMRRVKGEVDWTSSASAGLIEALIKA